MTTLNNTNMNADTSRRRRRPVSCSSLIGTFAVILTQQMTGTTAFVAQQASPSPQTALFFRNHLADDTLLPGPSTFYQNPNLSPSESSPVSLQATPLPTWLALPRGHLAETNLKALHTAMRTSFFTESESLKLLYAIEEAAGNDRNKVAGAAEFCLILTECMEMGLNALVAAAFHYCSCATARQATGPYTLETADSVESFGKHAVQIATDAARLKRLEMVAAAVMLSGDKARVTPDGTDAENLRKLLLSETKDWRALAIRSAACLYRLKGLQQAAAGQVQELTPEAVRCAREALFIYAPLASRLGMHRLKNELEGAAFRQLYRRQYEMVTSQSTVDNSNSNIDQSMTGALDNVQTDMTSMLEQDSEFMSLVDNFSVTARVKEPYSMWKKMLRLGYVNILQVPDALALRVVLTAKKLAPDEPSAITRARERALCYYAQKLCIQRWGPNVNDPRFKDYIESPKPNGYQSLHYTAKTESLDGQEWTMEIQVRSGEMHQVAEFGLACHWDYKAQQKSDSDEAEDVKVLAEDHSSDAYLRSVQEWHWQQHGQQRAEKAQQLDSSPASAEPVVLSDIWQSRVRADRIRARTQRLAPYIQALTAAQSELTRDFVFVFVTRSNQETPSEGKVLALPAGACVVDALREADNMHWNEHDLSLNGGATAATRRLQNGDVLTIPARVAAAV